MPHPVELRDIATAGIDPQSFAIVAIGPSRAVSAPRARVLMRNADHVVDTALDGQPLLAAAFAQEQAGLLMQVLYQVHGLRAVHIFIRGQYVAAGSSQASRLAQWVACFARKQWLIGSANNCRAEAGTVYRLHDGEQPTEAGMQVGRVMSEQAVSADPRMSEVFLLPCQMLAAYASRKLHRGGASGETQLHELAHVEGFDLCPMYDVNVLRQIR